MRLASLGWSGPVALLAACSGPTAKPDTGPEQAVASPAAEEWRPPVIATVEEDTTNNFARLGGAFEIVNGCLSFVSGSEIFVPVFNRKAPPVATPEGLVWGGRTLRYGQQYTFGGGTRPASLPVNEEAKRACRGIFVKLWGAPDPLPNAARR
jgi:hypothetical protein